MAVVILFLTSGGVMTQRLSSLWSDELDTHQARVAYESYQERKFVMEKSIEGIEHYPILGIGAQNFETYSTVWREVHVTYLQIAVEGGIPSLILYLLFFWRGFRNLKHLLKRKDLESDLKLFTGALHASLIGFTIGALFSPEAYQFFPYFAVAYTSALLACVKEKDAEARIGQTERQTKRGEFLRPRQVPVHT